MSAEAVTPCHRQTGQETGQPARFGRHALAPRIRRTYDHPQAERYPDSRHTRAGEGCWGSALTATWGHDPAAAGRRRLRRIPSRRGPKWTEPGAHIGSSDGCPDDRPPAEP